MTRSTGTSGLILSGIAAERFHGIAHGGKIDDGRNAGEVLHQHAGWPIGNLNVGALRLEPFEHGANVLGLHRATIFVPQEVLRSAP